MVAFPTTGGYGNALVNSDGAGLVDTEDGIPALGPGFQGATGALAAQLINPSSVAAASGLPVLNAILIELRVLTALLYQQSGNYGPIDVQQMRANELWDISPTTGVV